MQNLITMEEASRFASSLVGKEVTISNINYLIQYGRIDRFPTEKGTYVDQEQLVSYYRSFVGRREIEWKDKLGQDTNWALSFDNYSEAQTTKHVHRLHPYKGKFIPQLVEYFLDSHTDEFKHEVFFTPGDIVLDPFCGSGTTLVQANELGMHAIGIDISAFNAQISNCKVQKYDIDVLAKKFDTITGLLEQFEKTLNVKPFEDELLEALYVFNVEREEEIVFSLDAGEMTNAPNFTADCFFEDDERVVAIELKSVRPNSGEMRGEKQKILLSKAALRILYPGKKIYYYFGFPFDPLASTDTGYDKAKFMDSVIEMTKFCAPEEVLLSDELWSFLSGAPGTMQEILDVISDIATPEFYENLEFIMEAHNITQNPDKYRAIIRKWHLYDEIEILDNWGTIAASARKDVAKYRNQGAITQDGKFNVSRNKALRGC